MPSKSRQKTPKTESASRSPNRVPRTGAKPVKGKAKDAAKAKPAAKSGAKTASKPAAKSAARATAPVSSPIKEGQRAPAFEVTRDGGVTVRLADFAGKNLVIFFYPRADTPGCCAARSRAPGRD